jgi:FKBP-type peptidyl-prolyl cis-trans isomerase
LVDLLRRKDEEVLNANDVTVGTGRAVKKGDTVTIDYTATAGGNAFDDRKNVKLKIGSDRIAIPGFDQALMGMQVGGVREVKIPPALSRGMAMEKIGMVMSTWTVTLKSVN